ncbi:LysM peptidoglycan-binding domain-containing protein [Saccharopolyspora gloriosae]|uniref:LysM peptidoglycan-binding domain-containing protein n=1 Tax=Saccharopolyspora gloriosae TaxID=455344 RepID=UPI001FB6CFA8|nr:LysM peptidoglycan-binding domain-containing protein [Saccharopolyspora gloriosae]
MFVHRGDTLWLLAKIHLGDGNRWHEITHLNPHLSPEPQFLLAGQWLRMPDDAVNTEPPPLPDDVRWVTVGNDDTLTNLAQHHLGNPERWQEIYELNYGRTQPSNRTLRYAHVLMPGWRLALPPTESPIPPVRARDSPPPAPPPHQQAPPSPAETDTSTTTSAGSVVLASGGVVAATLAAAVTTGMVLRQRRRRRTYTPGSGDRSPPRLGPAVHTLRLAYDHAHPAGDEAAADTAVVLPATADHSGLHSPVVGGVGTTTSVEVGVRDERAHAVDLAALGGLGLTGTGAEATARSLLVHLLATTNASVVIPDHDACALLGEPPPDSPRLHLAADLSEAINELANLGNPGTDHVDTVLAAVLVASIDRPHQGLHAALDSAPATAGILIGDWPAATARVRADGTVTTVSPAIAELRGTQLFHLNSTDTRDLLDLLTDTIDGPPADSHAPSAAGSPEPDGHDETAHHARELGAEPPDSQHHTEELDADHEHGGNGTSPQENQEFRLPEPPLPATGENPHDLAHGRPDRPAGTAPVAPTAGDCGLAERPITLAVLGPPTLTWHTPDGADRDLTSMLAPKHKALLVFLALHPRGTSRATAREALWPDARGRRPYNAFYAALSQIRKTLADTTDDHATHLILQRDEHITLNPQLVTVDYWQLTQAEHDQHRANTDEQRFAAQTHIAETYRGELADGMSALWLDGPREAAHRTALDALAGMAAHYRGNDPQRQLQLLEHARFLNPENEAIYRDIIRVQAELGRTDAISRTVHLLTTTLADIGERPDPGTLTLARSLQARHDRAAG